MPEIKTGRTQKQISRDVNSQVKRAEAVIASLFADTPEEKKHDLLCAIMGIITEIALSSVDEGEDPKVRINHLEALIENFYHATELTNLDREGRVSFCLGCDKDGNCMAQALVDDWEEHESVPESQKS